MLGTYEDIDAGITFQCRKLEQRGIPLDLSELNLRIFRKKQALSLLKERINQTFGFIPVFSKEDTWNRIFREVTGCGIPVITANRSKISMSRRTVEELKYMCPELVDVYQGLQLERLISKMDKVVGSKVESQGKFFLKPCYKIDPTSGQILQRNPNLRPWNQQLKCVIREPGSTFLLVWYDALELTVLQDLSQDPVLGSDLESIDPYKTMACRFWEISTPSSEQIFIARLAFSLFCNGVKPDRFYNSINTTYSDRCCISLDAADRLYEKFIQHYTVSCEYFNQISRMRVVSRSMFGRVGLGSSSRCYPMVATTVDITKLGFLSILEDSRLEKLGVKPLALVSNKMILSVPDDQDLEQVKGYILNDSDGAYVKYALKTCITLGSSWGECELAVDLFDEEDL